MEGSALEDLAEVLVGTGVLVRMDKVEELLANDGVCLRAEMGVEHWVHV
jgi:hypothetical protein